MPEKIEKVVQDQYAAVARSGLSSHHEGVRAVAEAFGYSPEELASIPAEANMGLSCGNPTALAALRPGEVVVDLGCGGGLDVFLAARKVGPTGKAIGIDMTADMLDLARRNAAKADNGKPLPNVEFHQATIDHLSLPDASVDVVISNCVINLAPDKGEVFAEAFRVLRPGGRMHVSDLVLAAEPPEELREDTAALVGCVGGAIAREEYLALIGAAGFTELTVDAEHDATEWLNGYLEGEATGESCCCGSSCCGAEGALPDGLVASLTIAARKPNA